MLSFRLRRNESLLVLADQLKDLDLSDEILDALNQYEFTSSPGKHDENALISDTNFTAIDAIRDFVVTVGPFLTVDKLHALVNGLIRRRLEGEDESVRNMLEKETLARSFLAYELVHHKESAVEHFKERGCLYQPPSIFSLRSALFGSTTSYPFEVIMPEMIFFLFKKERPRYIEATSPLDIRTLRTDREEHGSVKDEFLNQIDGFIMKYLIAELIETCLPEENITKKMHDARGGYRGGRKVSLGLDIRDALITGDLSALKEAFSVSLRENGLDVDQFFDSTSITGSGTRSYIRAKFESFLKTGTAPAPKKSWFG